MLGHGLGHFITPSVSVKATLYNPHGSGSSQMALVPKGPIGKVGTLEVAPSRVRVYGEVSSWDQELSSRWM
jgi:hypothetical protein